MSCYDLSTTDKIQYLLSLHEKNGFAEVSKNLATYRSENIFVWIIKIIIQNDWLLEC